jgi:cytochrome P450
VAPIAHRLPGRDSHDLSVLLLNHETLLMLLTGSVDNTLHQGRIIIAPLLKGHSPLASPWYITPELIPIAVAEVIRFRSRFVTIFRQATADLDLNGSKSKRGSSLSCRSARRAARPPGCSASRDTSLSAGNRS